MQLSVFSQLRQAQPMRIKFHSTARHLTAQSATNLQEHVHRHQNYNQSLLSCQFVLNFWILWFRVTVLNLLSS